MTIQQTNQELVNILTTLVKDYPTLRMGQILLSFGFIDRVEDEFYKDPEEVLKRVMAHINAQL